MEYRCISADTHIDIAWLPHDLFVANATPALKDRVPYVTQGPDGPMWVTKAGLNLGLANGKGAGGTTAGGRRRYVAGKEHRLDRMESTGLFADSSRGIFRPTTPELRIKDQDRDGIQAEVMYGLLRGGSKMISKDPEAALELYRIYNEWLADFCGYDRARLVGLGSIPSHDLDQAVVEIHRVARLGLGGLDVAYSHEMTPLWDPYWDKLWQAAADVNLAVHFHTIGPPRDPPVPSHLPKFYEQVGHATRGAGFQLYMATILAAIINGGALERYPRLRIVLGESSIGWLPYVLERMDSQYENRFKRSLPLKMKPSDYWRRQCRATFQDDQAGAMLVDLIGADTVMWGSDYPHPDGVFPDSQEYIQRQFSRLPAPTRRKIICENAGRFYGLIR